MVQNHPPPNDPPNFGPKVVQTSLGDVDAANNFDFFFEYFGQKRCIFFDFGPKINFRRKNRFF